MNETLNLTILNRVLNSKDLILTDFVLFKGPHFEYFFHFLFAKGKGLNNALAHSC